MRARRQQTSSHGFTLTELMVVVVILAILAIMAVPMLRRDVKEHYEKFVNGIAQDIQRAKYEAISSKDDRSLIFGTDNVQLAAVTVGTATMATLRTTKAEDSRVVVAGALTNAQTGTGKTPTACAALEVRFSATNNVSFRGPGCALAACGSVACNGSGTTWNGCECSVTIYMRTTDDRYKSRIVIYNATGYARRYEGW